MQHALWSLDDIIATTASFEVCDGVTEAILWTNNTQVTDVIANVHEVH